MFQERRIGLEFHFSTSGGCGIVMPGHHRHQERNSWKNTKSMALDRAVADFMTALQRVIDEPLGKEDRVKKERKRFIGILAFLTRFISRVSPSAACGKMSTCS